MWRKTGIGAPLAFLSAGYLVCSPFPFLLFHEERLMDKRIGSAWSEVVGIRGSASCLDNACVGSVVELW